MSRHRTLSLALAALLVLSVAGGIRTITALGAAAMVKTAPAQILVTAKGMTLYIFSPDKPNKSVCTGGCAKYWPPMLVQKGITVAPSMTGISGKFGVTKRADGTSQLTYDGAPLYTWIKDTKPGDMTGQGVANTWWTVVVGAGAGAAVAGASDLVKTAPAKMLVSAKGMTLYLFSPDKPTKSACEGDCAKYWPPLELAAGATAPASMAGMKGKFGTVTRADGSSQLTYDGAPLYTWIKDKKPGDITGQGVANTWWIVTS